nr:ATP-binding protein [Ornithinimicrobium cryptoxanthini]
MLGEHQWVELKASLGPTNKGVNTELARDLASLSVDGGILIFGVADDGTPVGCDATSIAQRVSQVAAISVTPPLSPFVHDPVPNPDDDSKAVLIVTVPPSADGPHMVDGRYWGRSAHGKRTLSDPEIRRILDQRTEHHGRFEQRLQGLPDRDPLLPLIAGQQSNGHVYLLAEPVGPILAANLSDPDVLRDALRGVTPSGWHAGLDQCPSSAHDPDGAALAWTSHPVEATDEKWLTYVSVKDDGRVIVVGGGATAKWRMPGGDEQEAVLHGLIATLTVQWIEVVRELALNQWGYQGEWRVGIHCTKLMGKPAQTNGLRAADVRFKAPDYTKAMVSSLMTQDVTLLADRLLAGLYRGLGYEGWKTKQVLTRR